MQNPTNIKLMKRDTRLLSNFNDSFNTKKIYLNRIYFIHTKHPARATNDFLTEKTKKQKLYRTTVRHMAKNSLLYNK